MTAYLNALGLVCALGRDKQEVARNLFAGDWEALKLPPWLALVLAALGDIAQCFDGADELSRGVAQGRRGEEQPASAVADLGEMARLRQWLRSQSPPCGGEH